MLAHPVAAEPMRFHGVVEPSARAEVTTLLDGVVRHVHVRAGDRVDTGQLLFEIEPVDDLESLVRIARAEHDARFAELEETRLVLSQQATLRERAATSDLRYERARHAVRIAEAMVEAAAARLAEAEREQGLRQVTAPMAGVVDRPRVVEGAFVEAEAGAPLAVIERLDPIHVAYAVPYDERLDALDTAGVATVEELLQRLEVHAVLPNGEPYGPAGTLIGSNVRIDPATGTLRTWAAFANPNLRLLPGLTVEIRSTLIAESN